jgi:hypothetical protein
MRMTMKDRFTESEWQGVLQAPMLAGMAITAADPGGLWGAIKEGSAMAGALVQARSGAASSIMAEVAAAFETSEGRSIARDGVKSMLSGRKPADAADACLARLAEISASVAAKAPDQSAAFNGWIKEIAGKVAEAGTEGGFLGFGGVKVSEAEKRTLAELDRALS